MPKLTVTADAPRDAILAIFQVEMAHCAESLSNAATCIAALPADFLVGLDEIDALKAAVDETWAEIEKTRKPKQAAGE